MYLNHKIATINGHKIELSKSLTATQYQVLACLNLHYGEIVGNQYLADKCAPEHGSYLYDWTARVHVSAINKALKGTSFAVYNIRSKGYQLIERRLIL